MTIDLDAVYVLDDRVSLRPERFGALAYHFGNRRLVFLKSPDMVSVLSGLDGAVSLADLLTALGIDPRRWPSFAKALSGLLTSEMIHRAKAPDDALGSVVGRMAL
ncbi:MAG TPA: mycofactocin biosynthesis chaperone MftB [Acidimicrobiaceae bacterium]|jgi:putative mycofactocin binding protein MftB|nr:mycofactocin biosynthesis chaperone MftB [Acidimicrobiaceae bacterium]